jgi:hypothetical protein
LINKLLAFVDGHRAVQAEVTIPVEVTLEQPGNANVDSLLAPEELLKNV